MDIRIYPDDFLDKIIHGDCLEVMKDIPDGSIDLIITSPPYFNAREYSHFETYDGYIEFVISFLSRCFDSLKGNGRICINIPDGYNRNPWIPIYADYIKIIQKIGYQLRGSIIWNKGTSAGRSSWGSWRSSSNPCLIDEHEMIIIAHKNDPKVIGRKINRDEFMSCTHSVWNIKPETKSKHPASYPLEIPLRLIKFYASQNAMVLDPFVGSGTTAIAAKNLGFDYIGIEKERKYVDIARERITNGH